MRGPSTRHIEPLLPPPGAPPVPFTTSRLAPGQDGRIGTGAKPDLVLVGPEPGGSSRGYAGRIRRDQSGGIE